jgi:hypothetical protein
MKPWKVGRSVCTTEDLVALAESIRFPNIAAHKLVDERKPIGLFGRPFIRGTV